MNDKYFRNYSLTCYGPNDGLPELLKSIAEGKPVIMDAGQLMVASFSTAMNINEIKSLLKDGMYSFIMAEMDPETFIAYTVNDVMQERLFDDFVYKKIELENLADIAPVFSGDGEYIEYEDIDASKLHSEMYLQDLIDTLKEAIEEEEYEYAGELRDEIKEFDPEFYEKFIETNKFLK
jgi:hypothetical protein